MLAMARETRGNGVGGKKTSEFKPTVPPLPGQQSKAEHSAQRKNRVLEKRLEVSLEDLARDRFRHPDYLQFVLSLERDKFEMSQIKIKQYLQNLQV
nr:hypothetical protein BaRGS_004733 [Batillaria attramentaria]